MNEQGCRQGRCYGKQPGSLAIDKCVVLVSGPIGDTVIGCLVTGQGPVRKSTVSGKRSLGTTNPPDPEGAMVTAKKLTCEFRDIERTGRELRDIRLTAAAS